MISSLFFMQRLRYGFAHNSFFSISAGVNLIIIKIVTMKMYYIYFLNKMANYRTNTKNIEHKKLRYMLESIS